MKSGIVTESHLRTKFSEMLKNERLLRRYFIQYSPLNNLIFYVNRVAGRATSMLVPLYRSPEICNFVRTESELLCLAFLSWKEAIMA